MRPLARWTIGNVSHTGKEILRESVKMFKEVYPEFDYLVCCNGVNLEQFRDLEVDLLQQEASMFPYALREHDPEDYGEATGCGWKLCPPRLNPDGCELWMDNDIVIMDRIQEIDDWLDAKEHSIISEGHPRARMFGLFDRFIKSGLHACAGLFGLPPKFDFKQAILPYLSVLIHDSKPLGGFDEQGLTVAAVTNGTKYVIVPIDKVFICEDLSVLPTTLPPAIHFVGANRKHWHRGWKQYKLGLACHLML
jgi:hypothetical protein